MVMENVVSPVRERERERERDVEEEIFGQIGTESDVDCY